MQMDNQVLKAVWERKGTSQNLALNSIGKQIFWMHYLGQFFISLTYVRSEDNKADKIYETITRSGGVFVKANLPTN